MKEAPIEQNGTDSTPASISIVVFVTRPWSCVRKHTRYSGIRMMEEEIVYA